MKGGNPAKLSLYNLQVGLLVGLAITVGVFSFGSPLVKALYLGFILLIACFFGVRHSEQSFGDATISYLVTIFFLWPILGLIIIGPLSGNNKTESTVQEHYVSASEAA